MFKLTVIRGGPLARTEYPLVQPVTSLGRSHRNAIVLNDTKVSRHHAEIHRTADGYVVRDLDSANGIKVNGSRVQSSALVASDHIVIGDTEFRVDVLAEHDQTVHADEVPQIMGLPPVPSSTGTTVIPGDADVTPHPPLAPVRSVSRPVPQPGAPVSPVWALPGAAAQAAPAGHGHEALATVMGADKPALMAVPRSAPEGAQTPPEGFPMGAGAPPAAAPVAPPVAVPSPAPAATPGPAGPTSSPGESALGPKLLEAIALPPGRIEIAGLDALVGWIARRAPLGDGAPTVAPSPSGIAVVGPAGCGKSLIARFAASRWSRPCYRLNLPYLVLHAPGLWPEKLAATLEQVAGGPPSVLALEDVDRAGDRFTSLGADVARAWQLASELLAHWVQTKPANPFLVITARDPLRAHPALFTPGGSLDEAFVIDLPGPRDRQSAIELALRARGRATDALDPKALADATAGFSVAQIQAGVLEALLRLGASPRDLATAELLDAFAAVRPPAESPADVDARRRAAAGFRPASTQQG